MDIDRITNFLMDVLSLVSDVCEVSYDCLVAVLHLGALGLQVFTHVLWDRPGKKYILMEYCRV